MADGVAALTFAGALPHRLAKDEAPPVTPVLFFPVATFSVTTLPGTALVVEIFPALSSLTTAPPEVFLTAASFWPAECGGIGCRACGSALGVIEPATIFEDGGKAEDDGSALSWFITDLLPPTPLITCEYETELNLHRKGILCQSLRSPN